MYYGENRLISSPLPNSFGNQVSEGDDHTTANHSNLTLESITSLDAESRRRTLGNVLYPLVAQRQHILAPKITGMLLELDPREVLRLIRDGAALDEKVQSCIDAIQQNPQPTINILPQETENMDARANVLGSHQGVPEEKELHLTKVLKTISIVQIVITAVLLFILVAAVFLGGSLSLSAAHSSRYSAFSHHRYRDVHRREGHKRVDKPESAHHHHPQGEQGEKETHDDHKRPEHPPRRKHPRPEHIPRPRHPAHPSQHGIASFVSTVATAVGSLVVIIIKYSLYLSAIKKQNEGLLHVAFGMGIFVIVGRVGVLIMGLVITLLSFGILFMVPLVSIIVLVLDAVALRYSFLLSKVYCMKKYGKESI